MIYEFICDECGATQVVNTKPLAPPPAPYCCARQSRRLYNANIDTSQCRDADFIPHEKRVTDTVQFQGEDKKERAFQKHIDERRKLVREAGRSPTGPRMTHSVPADLFHGKIRETGDKQYWDDPRNLNRHSSCRVDP